MSAKFFFTLFVLIVVSIDSNAQFQSGTKFFSGTLGLYRTSTDNNDIDYRRVSSSVGVSIGYGSFIKKNQALSLSLGYEFNKYDVTLGSNTGLNYDDLQHDNSYRATVLYTFYQIKKDASIFLSHSLGIDYKYGFTKRSYYGPTSSVDAQAYTHRVTFQAYPIIVNYRYNERILLAAAPFSAFSYYIQKSKEDNRLNNTSFTETTNQIQFSLSPFLTSFQIIYLLNKK